MKIIEKFKFGGPAHTKVQKMQNGGNPNNVPNRRELQTVRSRDGAPMTALYEDNIYNEDYGKLIGMYPNTLPTLDVIAPSNQTLKSERNVSFLTRVLRDRLYKNLTPIGYKDELDGPENTTSRAISAILGNKSDLRDYVPDIRNDAWALYLGLDQPTNSFRPSEYRPTNSSDPNAIYYDSDRFGVHNLPRYSSEGFSKSVFSSTKGDSWEHEKDASVMGQYRTTLGEDQRGKYISYYDIWDFDGREKGIGKGFEIYGRIYQDEIEPIFNQERDLVKNIPSKELKRLLDDTVKEIKKRDGVEDFSTSQLRSTDDPFDFVIEKHKGRTRITVHSRSLNGYPLGKVDTKGNFTPFEFDMSQIDSWEEELSNAPTLRQEDEGFNPFTSLGNIVENVTGLNIGKNKETKDPRSLIADYKKRQEDHMSKVDSLKRAEEMSPYNQFFPNVRLDKQKYGGMIKKYPFGGITDILDIFKNQDQSEWMGSLQNLYPDMGTTPEQLNENALSQMQGALGQARQSYGDAYRDENYDNYYKESFKNQSFGRRFFNPWSARRRATRDADRRIGDSIDSQTNSGFDPMDQANQFGQLFNLFSNFMGNFQYGGNTGEPEQGPVPIQAERGEIVALPDNTISKVKAKKLHKQMGDDEVTDILPPETLVASADKRMKFSKDEMKEISLGYDPFQYKESETGKPPKERTAADIMTKKKMTPAEYLKTVKSKYPTSGEKESDPFQMLADEENLESRGPYINAMRYITETKKPKNAKGIAEAKYGVNIPRTFTNQRPQKALTGLEIAALGNLTGGLGGIFDGLAGIGSSVIGMMGQRQLMKTADRHLDKMHDMGMEGFQTQRNLLGAGTAVGVAGDLLQDTRVSAPQLDTSYVDAMPQQMPRVAMDQARRDMRLANRPAIRYAMQNATSFGRGMNAINAGQANQMNAISQLAGQQALQNINLRNNYLQQRGALANQQIMLDTDAENRTRQASNQRLSSITGRGTNYFSNLGNIEGGRTQFGIGIEHSRMQNVLGGMQNMLSGAQAMPYQMAGMFGGGGGGFNTQGMFNQQQNPWGNTSGPGYTTPYYNPF